MVAEEVVVVVVVVEEEQDEARWKRKGRDEAGTIH